jgi:hypothetical protein
MKKLCILILIVALAGCGGKKEDSDASKSIIETRVGAAKLFPFEIGTEWVYQMSAYDTTVKALRVIRVDTINVLGDTIINGSKWYKIRSLLGEMGYGINWNDGLYYARAGQKPFLWAKYPSQVGETLTSVIGDVQASNTVAATELKIEVPAGEFFCNEYIQQVGPEKLTTKYYFAPGVGLIKMDIFDQTGATAIYENKLMEIKRKTESPKN